MLNKTGTDNMKPDAVNLASFKNLWSVCDGAALGTNSDPAASPRCALLEVLGAEEVDHPRVLGFMSEEFVDALAQWQCTGHHAWRREGSDWPRLQAVCGRQKPAAVLADEACPQKDSRRQHELIPKRHNLEQDEALATATAQSAATISTHGTGGWGPQEALEHQHVRGSEQEICPLVAHEVSSTFETNKKVTSVWLLDLEEGNAEQLVCLVDLLKAHPSSTSPTGGLFWCTSRHGAPRHWRNHDIPWRLSVDRAAWPGPC